jgi:hypothetical protein
MITMKIMMKSLYSRGHKSKVRVSNYSDAISAFHVRGGPPLRLVYNGDVILDGTTSAKGFNTALREFLGMNKAR